MILQHLIGSVLIMTGAATARPANREEYVVMLKRDIPEQSRAEHHAWVQQVLSNHSSGGNYSVRHLANEHFHAYSTEIPDDLAAAIGEHDAVDVIEKAIPQSLEGWTSAGRGRARRPSAQTDQEMEHDEVSRMFRRVGAHATRQRLGHATRFTHSATVHNVAERQEDASWNLGRLSFEGRWTKGLELADYYFRSTGRGQTIYIVDSGIRADHEEFANRGGRVRHGYSAVGEMDVDTDGHGTAIAALAGGLAAGLAKQAELVSVKVCRKEMTNTVDVIEALHWIIQDHKRKGGRGRAVVNYSGSGKYSKTLEKAVTEVLAAGMIMVVAAGNQRQDACTRSPAGYHLGKGKITVANVDAEDRIYRTSNFGPCVDVYAPGVMCITASIKSKDEYEDMTGTSASTAQVSGLVVYYLQLHPGASVEELYGMVVNHNLGLVQHNPVNTPNRIAGNGMSPRREALALVAVNGCRYSRGYHVVLM